MSCSRLPVGERARGGLRLSPDQGNERAAELDLPRDAWLIAYCA